MSGASPRGAAPEPPRSTLDIAIAMFLKRHRAVVAGIVLLGFFYIAVWTPLLATNLPLHFRGVDPGGAAQAARVARLETMALRNALAGTETRTREQIETSFGVVEFQLDRLDGVLEESARARTAPVRERLRSVRDAWRTRPGADSADAAPKDPEGAATLKALAAEMKTALEVAPADLRTRDLHPAWLALDWLDAFLMALSLTVLPAAYWLRRGPGRPRRPAVAAWVALVPAVLAAIAWGALVDHVDDPTDYRKGIQEGALLAESVTWAAVPYGLNENNLALVAQEPGPLHPLGTDESGRSLLSRLLWGSRISLSVGFVAVGIYVLIGIVIGAVAGFFGGLVDIVVSRFIEWVICFPTFFLILVIVAFLKDRTLFGTEPPQLLVIMVVIGITSWTTVARVVRAEFLKLVGLDFVLAARALGAPPGRIIFRHVLPNALAPVLVSATFGVAGAILLESSLSFLGLGITVPKPSWGGMLFTAQAYIRVSTWMVLWPGLAIFLVITCYNLVGEALRDALDPRLRQ